MSTGGEVGYSPSWGRRLAAGHATTSLDTDRHEQVHADGGVVESPVDLVPADD
jgi:hypothetical protein